MALSLGSYASKSTTCTCGIGYNRFKRDYFVGASLDDVLRDTGGGIKFADAIYSSHRVVDPSQIQGLNRRLYTLGSRCVQRGTSKSFSKH